MARTVIIAGASGLVGRHCLQRLASAAEYGQIISLVRRSSAGRVGSSSKVLERTVDFARIPVDSFEPGCDVYCAVGTTIRTAGSQQAFREVDLAIPTRMATLAAQAGARQFLVVSSVSASASSSNFYTRTKGEMEDAVSAQPLEAIHIFRPSLLLGVRHESRAAERIASAVMKPTAFLFAGPLRKYRAIEAETVASAMVRAAAECVPGVHVYQFDQIVGLASRSQA